MNAKSPSRTSRNRNTNPPEAKGRESESRSPTHEGFALRLEGTYAAHRAKEIIEQTLGAGWKVRRFGDGPGNLEVTPDRQDLAMSPPQAWEATYRLRAHPEVAYTEPLFRLWLTDRDDWNSTQTELAALGGAEAGLLGLFCGDRPAVPESNDPEWSLKDTKVIDAWQHFFAGSTPPGTGIVIGHPDTGYRRHPEIVPNLLTNSGHDFVDGDADAEDRLDQGFLLNPGHGTATASVIVSPRGAVSGVGNVAVSGTAPGAKLIPFRVERSVVLFSTTNLARAIELASDRGAHVISISMGGLGSWRLREAVLYAQRRGVIILSAAGNCVRFVVWPAAYDEVIAVAASNAQRKTWEGSCRGAAVDVTAPGESVWTARAGTNGTFGVERGSGTSFAVATVAGIAALWLAHHGRDKLAHRYGLDKIPFIFNNLLRASCTTIHNPTWTPGQFGAGLVDADKLLSTPLPDGVEVAVPAPAMFMDEHVPIDRGGLSTFAHLFELPIAAQRGAGVRLETGRPGSPLERTLASLLHVPEESVAARLNEVGQELAFYIATNPQLYKQFSAGLAASARLSDAGGDGGQEAAVEASAESVRAALEGGGTSQALRNRLAAQ